MLDNIKFFIQQDWTRDGYIFAAKSGEKAYLNALTFTAREEGSYIEPAAVFQKETLQGLFNLLWEQGFRPSDGTGNSGHIAAVQYHLEDMRKLVFSEQTNNTVKEG